MIGQLLKWITQFEIEQADNFSRFVDCGDLAVTLGVFHKLNNRWGKWAIDHVDIFADNKIIRMIGLIHNFMLKESKDLTL